MREPWMRRHVMRTLGFLWILLIAACAQLQPRERDVLIPASQLSDALAKRFSVEGKWLDIFSVKIERPKLTLDTAAQRLRTDFELAIGHPLSNRPLVGKATITGALGFDAASNGVMLVDPKIETLQLDSVPAVLTERVTRLTSVLGSDLLGRYTLTTLREKDLAAFGGNYAVVGFEIVDEGVRVKLRSKDSR